MINFLFLSKKQNAESIEKYIRPLDNTSPMCYNVKRTNRSEVKKCGYSLAKIMYHTAENGIAMPFCRDTKSGR